MVASVAAAGIALATIPNAGVISTCYQKKRGHAAGARRLYRIVLPERDLSLLEPPRPRGAAGRPRNPRPARSNRR